MSYNILSELVQQIVLSWLLFSYFPLSWQLIVFLLLSNLFKTVVVFTKIHIHLQTTVRCMQSVWRNSANQRT